MQKTHANSGLQKMIAKCRPRWPSHLHAGKNNTSSNAQNLGTMADMHMAMMNKSVEIIVHQKTHTQTKLQIPDNSCYNVLIETWG